MNKLKLAFGFCLTLFSAISSHGLLSQEVTAPRWNPGIDLVSSYAWRGSIIGSGPAVQPQLEVSSGNFTAGAWGSFDFNGFAETDLYFLFNITPSFYAGITDYYYPDLPLFNYTVESGSHAFELNLGFSPGNFSFQANYVFNKAGGVGSAGGDKYLEAGYGFGAVTLFAGAGDGWHTFDPESGKGKFKVCNIGIEAVKILKLTGTFELPLKAQLIFNPDQERLFIVAGITF